MWLCVEFPHVVYSWIGVRLPFLVQGTPYTAVIAVVDISESGHAAFIEQMAY